MTISSQAFDQGYQALMDGLPIEDLLSDIKKSVLDAGNKEVAMSVPGKVHHN